MTRISGRNGLYRRDPVKELIAQGAEIILNISASPWCDGKERTRLEMLQRVARDEKIPLAQVNLVGANDELIFDGHSVALNSRGEVIALGKGFAEEIFVADLKSESRIQNPGVRNLIFHRASNRFFPRSRWASAITSTNAAFKSVILGLSGGIDSALVAVLAADALGAENVFGVAMPARYSSAGSLTDAGRSRKISAFVTRCCRLNRRFWRSKNNWRTVFAGTKPNEAEENVQSRLRGVTLMALSNKFGALVLTTGNKSEMAVGYCTLYGDMNGALAPIADVLKTDVYKIARWVNREGKSSSRKIQFPNRRARSCARTRRTRIRCHPTKFWMRSWICLS